MLFGKNKQALDFGMGSGTVNEHLVELPFIFRHIVPPSKVLDIGCTGSPASLLLSILRYNVTGIDYFDYGYQHQNMKFLKGDFNEHNFGKEKFDVILAMNTIEHLGLQYYTKDEPRDKNYDVRAMTKVKDLLNKGGQLIFACYYGIPELVNLSGSPFARVYDDKALDVLLSTFDIKNTEYYMVADRKNVRQVPREELSQSRHYEKSGTYGVACVSAIKQ